MKVLSPTACLFIAALLAACGEERQPTATTTPVVAADPCAVEASLLASAKFLAQGSPRNAVNFLQRCRSTLSIDGLKYLDQVTADAAVRDAKNLATEKARDAKNKKILAEDLKRKKAERKLHGVSIGMTKEEVRDSNWGKPQSVNRTTNSYGIYEQWVYSGGNYLYFENGVLTSIQN